MLVWLLSVLVLVAPFDVNADPKGADEDMVSIPEGHYKRGRTRRSRRRRRRRKLKPEGILVTAFKIDRYEVTVRAYRACVDAGVCTAPMTEPHVQTHNWGQPDRHDHPINAVTWRQATTYCEWRGKRLPTELEWEYAARGPERRTYPWGERRPTCRRAVIARGSGRNTGKWGCNKRRTAPVGSRPKGLSPFGVMDMVGNVSEWTADDFAPLPKIDTPKADAPSTDDAPKVAKGGSFMHGKKFLKPVQRVDIAPDSAYPFLGFRCAK